LTDNFRQDTQSIPQNAHENPVTETVSGRINCLSVCEVLDKRSASEKRLVEDFGVLGETPEHTNEKTFKFCVHSPSCLSCLASSYWFYILPL